MKTTHFPRPFLVFLLLTLCSTALLSVITKSPIGKKNQNKLAQTETQWVNEQFSKLNLEERIAQSFMVACWSNKGTKHLDEIESQIETYKLGGLIFFQGERSNLVDAIDRFQSKTTIPLLIGMDAEWGISMRIENEQRFPYAQTIGAANDLGLTKKMGQFIGLECDQMGIHLNFAPDADVNLNPKNPVIGYRSFGSDPQIVAQHTAAFVTGLEETNVLSCVKHFPGHGDTDKDSHFELPTVNHTEAQFHRFCAI